MHRRRAVPPRKTGLFGMGEFAGSGLTRSTLTIGGSSGKNKKEKERENGQN